MTDWEKQNEKEWKKISFVLGGRTTPVVLWITCNSYRHTQKIYDQFIECYDSNENILIEFEEFSIPSLYDFIQARLPSGLGDKSIIHLFGIEKHINNEEDEKSKNLFFDVLNFERELIFRSLPYPIIFWSEQYSQIKAQKLAPDFWDWLAYKFHFEEPSDFKPKKEHDPTKEGNSSKLGENRHEVFYNLARLQDKLNSYSKTEKQNKRETLYILMHVANAYYTLQKYENAFIIFNRVIEQEAILSREEFEYCSKKLNSIEKLIKLYQTIDLVISPKTVVQLKGVAYQFYKELEQSEIPFPKPSTIQKLKTALKKNLFAQNGFAEFWAASKVSNEHDSLRLTHKDAFIRNLPWRLATEDNIHLAISQSDTNSLPKFNPSIGSPLKVLIVVSLPEGDNNLDYENVELSLLRAFSPLMGRGLITVYFAEDGSLENLESTLLENKYHILHFSGRSRNRNGEGVLAFEDPLTGQLKEVNADLISSVFKRINSEGHCPNIVILSTSKITQGTEKPNSVEITNSLLAIGVPAVVSMSNSILDDCAIQFFTAICEQLSAGFPLPHAFQKACQYLRDFEINSFAPSQHGLVPGQWLIPQLVLSQEIGSLIDSSAPESDLNFSNEIAYVKGEKGLLELLVRPHNYVFIGRRQEKRFALRLLKSGRAIILLGLGGVGKTALAEHLAIKLMAANQQIKVFILSEKTPTAESLLQNILTFLTIEKQQFSITSELALIDKPRDKFLHLLSYLSQFCDPLFIFDNIETFQQYDSERRAMVWNKDQHEDVLILIRILHMHTTFPTIITGRYPLKELPDLSSCILNTVPFGDFFKKCWQLSFSELSSKPQKESDNKNNFIELVKRLYTYLGGNYRALEFFDELYKLEKEEIFSFLEKLSDHHERLSHQSMEILNRIGENLVFDQLLSYLNEEDKDTLSILARFRIPVLPMAIGMQRNAADRIKSLTHLTSLTLVELKTAIDERNRYYVSPIVKELLQNVDFLEVDFSENTAGEYHEYIFHEQLSSNWLDELGEAFEWFYMVDDTSSVNRVGFILNDYYYERQQFQLSLNYGLRTEKISRESTNEKIWNNLGQVFRLYGQLEKALHYFEKSLSRAIEAGDQQGEGVILNNISQIYDARGDYDQALAYLEESLQIQKEIGDRQGEGATLNNISQIYDARGDYDQALAYLEESLQIQKEIGDRQGEGTLLNNMSQIHRIRGDYITALAYLEQSLNIRQEIGDRSGEGATLNNMATIAYARGDYDRALSYLEQSLRIRQEIGDRSGEGATLNNISQIYNARGDYDRALSYLEQSLRIRQEIGDRSGEGATLNNISQIYNARGDYDRALSYLEQSLNIRQEIGDRSGEGATLNNIGQIYNARGDYDRALSYLEQSLRISQEIGDISALANASHNIGTIYFGQENFENAVPFFMQAYRSLEQVGSLNAKVSEQYLSAIIDKIGEPRFKELLES